MLKIIVGNKAYSSWSLRGWLAVKQSGLQFEEEVVRMATEDWPARQRQPDLAPSLGKVPILWDGEIPIWESIAIVDYLADRVGRDRFWPKDDAARGFARSIANEMHAGYVDLRRACPTNFRRTYPARLVSAEVQANVDRIVRLWEQALAQYDGDGGYLFGDFSAADIMFAPVVTRFITYSLAVPEFAQAYCRRVMEQPFVAEWMAAAQAEPWVIEKFERPA